MKLLLNFNEKNFVIKVPSLNSIDELKTHISGSLTNPPTQFDVQYYDEDFRTYVELTSIAEIEDKSRLQLTKIETTKPTNVKTSKRKVLSPSTKKKNCHNSEVPSNGTSSQGPFPSSELERRKLDSMVKQSSNPLKQKRQLEDDLKGTKRKRQEETSSLKKRSIEDLSKVLIAAGGLPNFLPDRRKGQTDQEIEKLKSFMMKEVTAAAPQFRRVSQALDHSLSDRRQYIVCGHHSINEIHHCYPWIFTESELIREFSRICNEDMMMKQLYVYFHNVSGYVQKLMEERKMKDVIQNLPNRKTQNLDNKVGKEAKFNISLIGIPRLLGEDVCNLLVKKTKDCSSAVSRISIHYSGNESYKNVESYELCVDGRHIELTSRRRAVCASLAAHYAFNIGFCKQLFNFFTFIESEIFKLKTCNGPPLEITRLIADFKKCKR